MGLRGYMCFFVLAGWLVRMKMKQMVNCMCYMNNVAAELGIKENVRHASLKEKWG